MVHDTNLKTITYRIWTSNKAWKDVETYHWLADALRKSGIQKPVRVEFRSKRCWKPVSDHAVKLAVKSVFGGAN